ncbi:hypothetical protein ACQW02_14960 [Humitalea sp. 24SJ18S-53]|uniref:hypothetical protein n=1 Tax=Humitalea sp. 24SJ18S-53 TaxID=3422307 RepID=UPI003D67694B
MRILAALALGSALVLGGCQNPDGSPNVGGTVALGLGAVLATGLIIAASNNSNDGGYHRGGYGPNYNRGRGQPAYAYNRSGRGRW